MIWKATLESLKKKLCGASIQTRSRAAQPGGTETHGEQLVSGSVFWLQARQGTQSLGERTAMGGGRDLLQEPPGDKPGSPTWKCRGLLSNRCRASPPSTSGRRKEGEPASVNTVLSILPSPRGPRPVPKAMGRGAGLMRGRKEAALLGELMGVSGEH